MKKSILALTFLFSTVVGFSQTFEDRGFSLEVIDFDAKTCKITGFAQEESKPSLPENLIEIPPTACLGEAELNIIEIGDNAFSHDQFSYIEIPAGIMKIGENAFGQYSSYNSYDVKLADSPLALELAPNAFPNVETLYMGRNFSANSEISFSPKLSFLTVGEEVTDIPGATFNGLRNVLLQKGCKAKFSSVPANPWNIIIYMPEDDSEDYISYLEDTCSSTGMTISRYHDWDFEVDNITIEPSGLEIKCGESANLFANIGPYPWAQLIWTSNNPEILTVSGGSITANNFNRSGVVTVTAHALNGVKASTNVVVKPLFSLSCTEIDTFLGDTISLQSFITSEDTDNSLFRFRSDNETIVSVVTQEVDGQMQYFLEALQPGEAMIEIEYAGTTMDYLPVTAWEVPQKMEIDDEYKDITRLMWDGDSKSTLIPIKFTPDHKYVWKDISTSIEDNSIADINIEKDDFTGQTYLTIRHRQSGNTVITVTAPNGKGNAITDYFTEQINLTVIPFFDITKMHPEKGTIYLERIGDTLQLSAEIDEPQCMSYLDWSVITRDSLRPSKGIASVDDTGLVTALGYGEALVGAYCYPENLNGYAKFLCKVLKVVKLPDAITPDIDKIEVKDKHTFTVLIKHWLKHEDKDNSEKQQEICNDLNISIDDESVANAYLSQEKVEDDEENGAKDGMTRADVDEDKIQSGDYLVVEGLNEGTTNITLTAPNGVSVTIPVNVTSAAAVDIALTDSDNIKVFSSNGMLLLKAASKEDIESLPSGIYIIVTDGKATKLIR